MNWPAYAEYKDSSVPWLGDVPRRWPVDRIKWSVASSQNGIWGNEPDGGPDDIRCVRVADFDRPILGVHDREITNRNISAAERRGRLLRKGDLILEKSGGGEKSPVGFVVLYDHSEPAVPSNFVAKVSLQQGMEPRFWTYLHHMLYVSRITQRSIKQTSGIQNLDQQSYLDERVCFPSADEQVLIANFLDRETAKIDALIAKQEQLIATLREDRAATITQAVTKGLDPSVETADSGVVWLGPIPTSWTAVRLKHIIKSVRSGTSVNAADTPALPNEQGVLKTSCVSAGWFNPDANKTALEEEQHRLSCPVTSGTLIVNRANTPDLVGTSGYVRESRPNLFLSDKLWQVTFTCAMAEYVHYWTHTPVYRTQISANSVGASSSMQNLSVFDFQNLSLALPSMSEQRSIVEFLSTRVPRIDALVEKSTAMIETLREYRSALITNAVTGKIDVREAV